MKQYLELLNLVLNKGEYTSNRTNIASFSYFGTQNRYDLKDGFPLLTTKKIYFKAVLYELLWFISGNTNIKYLVDHDIRIWNEWPYEKYKKSSSYQNESIY